MTNWVYDNVTSYYGVVDADVLEELHKGADSARDRAFDEELLDELPEKTRKVIIEKLYPYQNDEIGWVCGKSVGPLEYSKPDLKKYGSTCEKGSIEIPLVAECYKANCTMRLE